MLLRENRCPCAAIGQVDLSGCSVSFAVPKLVASKAALSLTFKESRLHNGSANALPITIGTACLLSPLQSGMLPRAWDAHSVDPRLIEVAHKVGLTFAALNYSLPQ